jgi:hypothetical protein
VTQQRHRIINSFRVDLAWDGNGSRITCADGREYAASQFPKRIRNITESDAGIVLHLNNGETRRLTEQSLMEAAADSQTVEPLVDQLIESGQLDEAELEEAFLARDEALEAFASEFPSGRNRLSPSRVRGYENERDGKPRQVELMHVDKLRHFATHPDTHPELRKRVRAELRRRKVKIREGDELEERGSRGGADEAEMVAKARSYPPHAGGIGSGVPEPIGKGKGRTYPPGFQHIRNALIRSGHDVATASRIAYGALRRWARGGGKVKPDTRAKAAKVLGELTAGKGESAGRRTLRHAESATREATMRALREGIRTRTGLQTALGSYLSERGDRRPVNEDVESMREAAQRAISGHGPLKARSSVDRRVLEAQARAVTALTESALPEATRTVTTVTELAEPIRERAAPREDPPPVFVQLPPEKGTLPTVIVEQDAQRIGEVTVPRELNQADLVELQEQAIDLYKRTAAPTWEGRTYLSSAGRVELTQLVAALTEAFAMPENHPSPAASIGAIGPDDPMLPDGEAPPVGGHSLEEFQYADDMLKRSGYSRDGRSTQGDYLHRFYWGDKPLMEADAGPQHHTHRFTLIDHAGGEVEHTNDLLEALRHRSDRQDRDACLIRHNPTGRYLESAAEQLVECPSCRGGHGMSECKECGGTGMLRREGSGGAIGGASVMRRGHEMRGGHADAAGSAGSQLLGESTAMAETARRLPSSTRETTHGKYRAGQMVKTKLGRFELHHHQGLGAWAARHESGKSASSTIHERDFLECMIHVTTPRGKRYSREMGTQERAKKAASALRKRGHKVRIEGVREAGLPEQAGRAAVAQALAEARRRGELTGDLVRSTGPPRGKGWRKLDRHPTRLKVGTKVRVAGIKTGDLYRPTRSLVGTVHETEGGGVHHVHFPALGSTLDVHGQGVHGKITHIFEAEQLTEARHKLRMVHLLGRARADETHRIKSPELKRPKGKRLDVSQYSIRDFGEAELTEAEGFKRGDRVRHKKIPARGVGRVLTGPKMVRSGLRQWHKVKFPSLREPHYFPADELERHQEAEHLLWESGAHVSPNDRKAFYSRYGTVRGKYPIPPPDHPQALSFAKAALRRINQSDLTDAEKAKVRAKAARVIAHHRGKGKGKGKRTREAAAPFRSGAVS